MLPVASHLRPAADLASVQPEWPRATLEALASLLLYYHHLGVIFAKLQFLTFWGELAWALMLAESVRM